MEYTQDTFEHLFKTTRNKEGLLDFIKKNPNSFVPLLNLSLSNTPEAWRAAWLIGHTMKTNDPRIIPSVPQMIDGLGKLKEGHQRQILLILLKMDLNEDQEGKLFDACLTIWETIKTIPSTRSTAMNFILKTVKKFPELKEEVKLWTQNRYIESLSPGIKLSILKKVKMLE